MKKILSILLMTAALVMLTGCGVFGVHSMTGK
jgi:predicted small lipoprotein YifL